MTSPHTSTKTAPEKALDVYECPYYVGAEYSLMLTCTTEDTTAEAIPIRVTVCEILAFASNVVLKVNISSSPTSKLPTVACWKVFDRRYINDRIEEIALKKRRPQTKAFWTCQKEAEAKANPYLEEEEEEEGEEEEEEPLTNFEMLAREEFEKGQRIWDKQLSDMGGSIEECDWTDLEFDFVDACEFNEDMSQGVIEEMYRQKVERSFIKERTAYETLSPV
jgi:hypothetical protein